MNETKMRSKSRKSLNIFTVLRSKGVSVLAAAFGTGLIIFLTYAIARFAIVLTIDIKYRHLLQETLRVAQGIPNLWGYAPGTAEYKQAFEELHDQFVIIANKQNINLDDDSLFSVTNPKSSTGTVKLGFLPPASGCMQVDGTEVCNSQDQDIVASGGSVYEGDLPTEAGSSFESRKKYQNRLRNHPTELVLCYNPRFLGISKRLIRAAGYPRLIQSEQIAMVMPSTTIATTSVIGSTSIVPDSTTTTTVENCANGEGVYVLGWTVAGWQWEADQYQAQTGFRYTSIENLLNYWVTQTQGSNSAPACLSNYITNNAAGVLGGVNYVSCNNEIFSQEVQSWGGCGVYMGLQARSLAEFLGDPNAYLYQLNDTAVNYNILDRASWGNSYISYLDSNCRWVSSNSAASRTLCGATGISASPISLIWDENYDLDRNRTVVEFSLSPQDPNVKWSEWKASGLAPLLVYDPSKKRAVTSAEQLFGNFSFGGKRPNSKDGKRYGELWSNGFEALATLDRNKDGEITGDELDPLALWFDHNRNGKSEEGEVVSVAQAQVISLYFREPQRGADGKSYYLEIGFKRKIDSGRVVTGKSVDWFGDVYTSKQNAANAMAAQANARVSADTSAQNAKGETDAIDSSDSTVARGELTGIWIWSVLEKHGEKFPGFLEIRDRGDSIVGITASEAPVDDKNKQLKTAVIYSALTGRKYADPSNSKEMIEMLVKNGSTQTRSSVEILDNGTRLHGKAIQVANTASGNSSTVTYEWMASKIKGVTLVE